MYCRFCQKGIDLGAFCILHFLLAFVGHIFSLLIRNAPRSISMYNMHTGRRRITMEMKGQAADT